MLIVPLLPLTVNPLAAKMGVIVNVPVPLTEKR